jgi:hypothetical protein
MVSDLQVDSIQNWPRGSISIIPNLNLIISKPDAKIDSGSNPMWADPTNPGD